MKGVVREVTYYIPCEAPSKWRVSFTRHPDHVEVGLHFGDKLYAAHGFDITAEAFLVLAKELCE